MLTSQHDCGTATNCWNVGNPSKGPRNQKPHVTISDCFIFWSPVLVESWLMGFKCLSLSARPWWQKATDAKASKWSAEAFQSSKISVKLNTKAGGSAYELTYKLQLTEPSRRITRARKQGGERAANYSNRNYFTGTVGRIRSRAVNSDESRTDLV